MGKIYYKSNSFCEMTGCDNYQDYDCTEDNCTQSAKKFHKWLKKNGWQVSKICNHPQVKGNYVNCPYCGELVR